MNSKQNDPSWEKSEIKLQRATLQRIEQHLMKIQAIGLPTDVDEFVDAALAWYLENYFDDRASYINHVAQMRAEADDRLRDISDMDLMVDMSINRFLDHLSASDPV